MMERKNYTVFDIICGIDELGTFDTLGQAQAFIAREKEHDKTICCYEIYEEKTGKYFRF